PPSPQYFDAPNPHGAAGTHRIAFYEWGSPHAPVIICIHGLTRNGRDFDFLARALCNDYRVIAIDVAGRGNSDKLSDLRWYDNGIYMQDILALTERMNIQQFDWIGTSMGGIIGMMIASLVPNKITRLILNDIGALIPKEGLMRIGQYVGKQPLFPSLYEADAYMRKIMQPFGITHSDHWDHMLQHSLVHHSNGSVSFAYDPAIGDAFRLAASEIEKLEDISLWMLWESITCPALILRGEDSDILTKEVAAKMCDTHPNASLIEFEAVGHAPALMNEQQIGAITNWLATTQA
ncbi:MAG: alpha/beta hydrolase, partial [Alphaproteobacteria bacterium]|nr:alpha/beta hydrolase [Alphaproteobacteria bacterium]